MTTPATDRPTASRERASTSTRSTASHDHAAATQLLTSQEAAERLCMSPEWVRKKVQRREIPFIRLGRCVRFTEAQLAEIVTAAAQPGPARQGRGSARTKL
ncbi:MAG: helix-turn-helix domain-containing protein [Trebonia sp.]